MMGMGDGYGVDVAIGVVWMTCLAAHQFDRPGRQVVVNRLPDYFKVNLEIAMSQCCAFRRQTPMAPQVVLV